MPSTPNVTANVVGTTAPFSGVMKNTLAPAAAGLRGSTDASVTADVVTFFVDAGGTSSPPHATSRKIEKSDIMTGRKVVIISSRNTTD
jgi:hypothetical protein